MKKLKPLTKLKPYIVGILFDDVITINITCDIDDKNAISRIQDRALANLFNDISVFEFYSKYSKYPYGEAISVSALSKYFHFQTVINKDSPFEKNSGFKIVYKYDPDYTEEDLKKIEELSNKFPIIFYSFNLAMRIALAPKDKKEEAEAEFKQKFKEKYWLRD